jgi:YfiH family protein
MTDQKADAMVSNQPGACLGILTADCQPVLFYDANAQVIGAAHAGWRGTKDGILEATLAAMEKLGATRTNIVAVIGPTISQTAYEVGPDFKDALCDHDPQAGSYFAQGLADRWLFNLPGYGIRRLQVAGVGRAEWTGHCTFSDPNRFFSYRRSTHAKEVDYGRLISIIRL